MAKRLKSFQDSNPDLIYATSQGLPSAFLANIGAVGDVVPRWWSRYRDDWLFDFVHREGNDLLAGAVATLTAKIAAANWYLEGPIELCKFYRDILLYQSEQGEGWDALINKWVQGFLIRDGGGVIELLRATQKPGPALGFRHIDESKLYPTNDPLYPYIYMGENGDYKVRRDQFLRLVDEESGRDIDLGTGFSSVSRAISTAIIMMEIVRYKRERLSDLPPAAILFLSNLTGQQWEDIIEHYEAGQRNSGNKTWRSLLVACGYDPEYPINAELFELSKLPEHYDERSATEMAVYTFALAFRVDPREFWPVSAGPLGTATEANIQHKKAKAKGEGIIFTAIERALNAAIALPPTVKFRFDYRDAEDDMQAEEIRKLKLQNIRMLWEASPNRQAVTEGGEPNEGIITTEEARELLVYEQIIPPHIIGFNVEEEKLYDTRAWGQPARIYRDGSGIWK